MQQFYLLGKSLGVPGRGLESNGTMVLRGGNIVVRGMVLTILLVGIVLGVDFGTALLDKYVGSRRTNGQESVILGSSNGAIVVEAPRMDGVRARISQVERLRRISLDNCDVATPGDLETIARLCPSVQSLDLSHTLLGDWEDVMDIIRQMPNITTLELNLNRLRFIRTIGTQLPRLTHLRLNSTMTSWAEACEIFALFPGLQDLQLGYNQLQRLDLPPGTNVAKPPSSLTTLNLDSNVLDDWVSIMHTCATMPSLHSLMLPSNAIASIPPHSEDSYRTPPLFQMQHLSIMENPITSWGAIDSIATWLPNLKDLSISLEPLKLSGSSSTSSRDFVISRLPQLTRLNGTEITERDRSDAELFYLSWISKHETGSEWDITALHPRWRELSNKYQTSNDMIKPTIQNLGSSIIAVNVVRLQGQVSKGRRMNFVPPITDLRVLPTMSTKVFIMKLKKSMKLRTQIEPERLWVVSLVESNQVLPLRLFDGDLLREIAWSGVEDGCFVGLVET
ncbi:hypothetical protein FS749_001414 [Ceratobasidium sp. UAMH 11750]|nr:hypothetical protein FS749_001414 [Ceratobasidium sp. UAMH 11750]